tara:strand:+ start:870 stop:1043 length:174 start_codon:yes stop_codon:yes gene_type:complete
MKKILVRDNEGRFGHAVIKGSPIQYWEVRMIDDYDKPHTCNTASFFIYYEVMDEIED